MEYKLKPISHAGINEAISKVELYRYLNEPGEAESICRDILAWTLNIKPHYVFSVWRLPISSTEESPIVTLRPTASFTH